MGERPHGCNGDDYTDMNIGASFNIGFMTIMGHASKREYSTQEQKTGLIGVTVPLGAGTLKAAYLKSAGSSAGVLTEQYEATQMSVGFVYDLSKRTAVYTHASRINNDGNGTNGAVFAIGGGPAGMGRGQTSTGYEFGFATRSDRAAARRAANKRPPSCGLF